MCTEASSSAAPQPPQVDVNTLLSQLLAAGLIKKAENESSAPPTSDANQQITVKEEKSAVLDRRASEVNFIVHVF